jgi:hypothetical protein
MRGESKTYNERGRTTVGVSGMGNRTEQFGGIADIRRVSFPVSIRPKPTWDAMGKAYTGVKAGLAEVQTSRRQLPAQIARRGN